MENQLRTAIYLRLSDEDKDKTNKFEISESIKNQRNLLLEEIKKRPEFILVDEYSDEDLSGAGTYRPEFERLIKDCENGKIDVVLCKSQSRFSRDMEIIEKYLHNKFIEWNIRFIGISDNADTNSPGNKKSRQINGLVNEWYLEDVSNNIKSAFKAKMKQGEFISPFTSYGYSLNKENNNKLVIDPIASEIVKEIYNLYLKGLGFTSIAKYLNNNNIPSPSLYKYQKGIKLNIISNKPREEIKWNPNAIKTILSNELYIGNLIQGKRTTISYKNHKIKKKKKNEWIKIENTHEAIIDKNTFYKVQTIMKEKRKPSKRTGKTHNFSGKVFCLECKSIMRKKNSKLHEYLVCSNNKDNHKCSNNKSIRYDELEDIILNTLNKKINKYYDEEYLKINKTELISNIFIKKIETLKKQEIEILKNLSITKKYLKELYEDKVNKVITLNQFKELLNTYTNNEKNYNEQLKSIKKEITFFKTKESLVINNNVLNKYKIFKHLNKIIIDEFIEKIYIGKLYEEINTRDIEIKWNLN